MTKNKMKILYVEDEQWIMGGIIDSLSIDYEVLTAKNADQALEIIESNENIRLIILDIMMPPGIRVQNSHNGKTTGVELARIIVNELKSKMPIICYTVVNDPAVAEALWALGVKEIVSKKELPSELEVVIKKYIKRK